MEAIADVAPEQVEGLKDRLRGNPPFPGGLQSAYQAFHGKDRSGVNELKESRSHRRLSSQLYCGRQLHYTHS